MTDRAAPIELIRSDSLAAAAVAHRDRLRAELAERRAAEVDDIAFATANGQALGNRYWHERHATQQRLRAAADIVAALQGASHG